MTGDLVVAGGGLSGVCCAIIAARQGLKVILIQDRPVLGGNSSSEVRLWILGATSHMGNNNRWAREGGLIDELLVENTFRNAEGNPIIFDAILLDKVFQEKNITLLLNTAIYRVDKENAGIISSVSAFCSQNQTEYKVAAPLFCDASGDGIVGFLSGAAFRMGAESKEEFGELFAPSEEYGELLGHSIYFYSKDTGKPVTFTPPSFALRDITKIPKFKSFNTKDFGCKLWWIEYGGRLHTVRDTEEIKWELWKVVYSVWDYIKNSGEFPEADTLTLEWMGTIPGKRESRRFEGDYILRQQDIIQQKIHPDAVAYGGWSIDLHPADGVFSEKPGCNQWHPKGVYQIPYRSLYSRNIYNLFFAGRIISATHVAFGSTRVMATSAYTGQAVGMAAAIATNNKANPRDLNRVDLMKELQNALLKTGHYIPGLQLVDNADLVKKATIRSTSTLSLKELGESSLWKPLDISAGQLIPIKAGSIPALELHAYAEVNTRLDVELRISSKNGNYTPDLILEKKQLEIHPGRNSIELQFERRMEEDCYAFILLLKNPLIRVNYSEKRVTGILSVFNLINHAVSNYGKQTPPADIGVDSFEFWCPQRRPQGHNIAMRFSPAVEVFSANNVKNGIDRPTLQPNAWVADWSDPNPQLFFEWKEPQEIKRVVVLFDTDYDHPMESVLMTHPEAVMPFCVRNFKLQDEMGNVLHYKKDNYQTLNSIEFEQPVRTQKLILTVEHPSDKIPAAVFSVRCYSY